MTKTALSGAVFSCAQTHGNGHSVTARHLAIYGTAVYHAVMVTVIETPVFKRSADAIWSAEERLIFISWLAENALAGDTIPGTGGLRKVRWSRPGMGKRGGARVIYYNVLNDGRIYPVRRKTPSFMAVI